MTLFLVVYSLSDMTLLEVIGKLLIEKGINLRLILAFSLEYLRFCQHYELLTYRCE